MEGGANQVGQSSRDLGSSENSPNPGMQQAGEGGAEVAEEEQGEASLSCCGEDATNGVQGEDVREEISTGDEAALTAGEDLSNVRAHAPVAGAKNGLGVAILQADWAGVLWGARDPREGVEITRIRALRREDLAHLVEAEGRQLAGDEVSASILQGAESRRACMQPGVVGDAVGTGSSRACPPEKGRDVMGRGSEEGNGAR